MADPLLYEKAFSAIQHMRLGKRILAACRIAGISRAQLVELAGKDAVVGNSLKVAEDEADEILADSLVDAEEWAEYGAQDPKVAAVWSKNVRWLLARRNPGRFGDKITVEQTTTVDVVITQRLEAAKARVMNLGVPCHEVAEDGSILPTQGQYLPAREDS